MKALVCTNPGEMDYREIPEPELKPGFAIIRIRKICVCGTDLHAFEGTQPFFNYPRILGHELSGELIEFEDAPGFKKGDRVTFLPYLTCGKCIACRNGKTNCCMELKCLGVHTDGGMCEYIIMPVDKLHPSAKLTLDQLALVETLGIGCHGVNRSNLKRGEWALVIGAGPIGLAAIQ